ncbi:hypothetical protein BJ322DRAFT_1219846 [Thelephora terrestris]|uniref:Non-ribosomal peptide synthetase n=1 Tax=Thelephora terrestris TaxID=56493 RepID=A0A9P6L5L2_9AGAM|nr:hypothetical protein BJ322DRAFT_1219846 [Thelephora terrestris]
MDKQEFLNLAKTKMSAWPFKQESLKRHSSLNPSSFLKYRKTYQMTPFPSPLIFLSSNTPPYRSAAHSPTHMPADQGAFQSSDETLPIEKHLALEQPTAFLPSMVLGDSSDIVETKEQGFRWEGYLDEEYTEKRHSKPIRNLRYMFFSVYRRLFGITFAANMSVFVGLTATHQANTGKIAYAVISNLFVSILMRQEHVINILFKIFTAWPQSTPLMIRRISARISHIGGLHSGCGISGVIWLVLFVAMGTHEYIHGLSPISLATVVVSWVILGLLLVLLVFAYPAMRAKFHDSFDLTHRFLGWTSVALVWAQIVLFINDNRVPGEKLPHACKHNVTFWLQSIITLSVILPWIHLRKVNVRAVTLSKHATRLYFDYTSAYNATARTGTGTAIRITDSPLKEWHAFATIREPGRNEFSLIVSRAGDWTSKVIDNPPTKLWVRGIPTHGFLRVVPLFRRMILVATGSGIGPCANAIFEDRIPVRLLWASPNARETFGDEFVDQILRYAPDAVLYDTRKHGRPDLVKLTLKMVKEFNAEAVAVISNQPLTEKLVYGLNSRGIPAYGAIFDS